MENPPANSPPGGNGDAPAVPALPYESKRAGFGWLQKLFPASFARLRRNRRSPWVPRILSLLICLGVFAVVSGIRMGGGLEFLELKVYDMLLSDREDEKRGGIPSRVAVIGIIESDIQNHVVQYPIADVQMAELLRTLLSYKPRAVGIDIFRDQLTPMQEKPATQPAATTQPMPATQPIPATQPNSTTLTAQQQYDDLIDVMQDRSVFIVIEMPTPDDPIEVRAPLRIRKSQQGFADLIPDSDDVVRRAMLFTFRSETNQSYTSLAARTALRYLGAEKPAIRPDAVPTESGVDAVRLGKTTFYPFTLNDGGYVRADAGGTQILMDYRGGGLPPIIPISDVLSGEAGADAFADKVVFIGMTARSVKDLHSTPLNPKTYGVLIHAMIADQLLRGAIDGHRPTRVWPDSGEYAWALCWTLLGGLIGFCIRAPWQFIVALAAGLAMLIFAVLMAFGQQLWIPLVPPLLGWLGAAGFVTQYMSHHEKAERTVLNELFKRMISEDVAETLWQRRDELLDEGHLAAKEVRATVLFTDLEGFTTITESMDKSCLMDFLNEYMTVMSDVISSSPDAFVNKYIGDAVMAVFGPPLVRTEAQARVDARNAVECALMMREKLAEHRERWERACVEGIRKKSPGAPEPQIRIRMRIGIQSGIVVAGSLGSAQRLEYTVIGDTVNTAARLENYERELMPPDFAAKGCRILIGQDTLDLLPPGEYLTREVGSIQLKGKEQMVSIHGVIGRATPSPAAAAGPGSQAALRAEAAGSKV